MAKVKAQTVSEISSAIYDLLHPLESSERHRVFQGTMLLLGESAPVAAAFEKPSDSNPGARPAGSAVTAKQFFDSKQPNSKVEELAAAARYGETHEGLEAVTKDQLERIVKAARRNFDSAKFNRDIDTGRTNGYFNKGGSATDGYTLSYYGQNYVDALPDREAARALKRPRRGGGSKNGKAAKAKPKASK